MSQIKKVLIVDEMQESLIEMLNSIGYLADYQPLITRNQILETLVNYDGLIIRSKTKLDKSLFDAGSNLRFVARAGAGMEEIDIAAATAKKIALLNAPEGNRDAVGEHVVGMLLCLFNHLKQADSQIRAGIWNREANRGVELKGKTVGLIGYGNNGQATAQKLAGFGCKVIAYDKYKSNFSDLFVEEVDMSSIFENADILSLHIPLTEETKMMIDENFIRRFKKPFYLVNVSRGAIASLSSIYECMKKGLIMGVCLDVLENEKLATLNSVQLAAFEGLKSFENVLFSPHVAGWTNESYIRINEVLVEKIRNLDLSSN